jgi:hypothetical protein
MIYNGQQIDDRFGVVEPFLKWADKEIQLDGALFNLSETSEQDKDYLSGQIHGLRESVQKLLTFNEQAVRDHDGNIAAAREAN